MVSKVVLRAALQKDTSCPISSLFSPCCCAGLAPEGRCLRAIRHNILRRNGSKRFGQRRSWHRERARRGGAERTAQGAIYTADPLGEGAGTQPDADPLLDFAHVDCLTYVEQVYALTLAPDRAHFADTLQRIRYRDGQIAYRWRNHYTVADWLPANAWFIRDVTDAVGAGHLRTMTKTIDRGKFFAGKGLKQYADLPAEEVTTSYLPREQAAAILGKLQTGDMIIFVISTPGIIAGHVGLLRVERGVVCVQHASPTVKGVITLPLLDYLHQAPSRFLGFKVARMLPHG